MSPNNIGWILVHAHKQYPCEGYETPREELEGLYEPGSVLKWHWNRPSPLKEGGPYTLLFAWEGTVFGEGVGKVTHAVNSEKHNFAFDLTDYAEITKAVFLSDLSVPEKPRSLIRLTPEILSEYHRLK
jgi:hypothetical protein